MAIARNGPSSGGRRSPRRSPRTPSLKCRGLAALSRYQLCRHCWSMRRPTISHVTLCGAHVGVPFKSIEYLCRGAAIHDSIEGGAPVRQPDVEPSNKLQLVPFSDLLLGALRRRWTKDCDDLTRLYGRRTELVLCEHETPNTNQQREFANNDPFMGLRPRGIDKRA